MGRPGVTRHITSCPLLMMTQLQDIDISLELGRACIYACKLTPQLYVLTAEEQDMGYSSKASYTSATCTCTGQAWLQHTIGDDWCNCKC